MTRKRARITSVAIPMLLGVFACVGAWQIGWHAADIIAERFTVVTRSSDSQGRSYREMFASLPDFAACIDHVHWNGGDGAEAVRLMSIVKSLELGRYRQDKTNARARVETLVSEVWREHPDLVTASMCVYCGQYSDIAWRLLEAHGSDRAWFRRLAAGHPLFLTRLAKNGALSDDESLRIALVHAELFHPGDAPTARFVGSVLVENGRHDSLLAWASKGLNGWTAIDGVSDLSALPPAVVQGAWEHGVSIGSHPIRLTGYLLERGYRPALRWLIWVLDGRARYISANAQAYEDLFRRYVDLPERPGPALARFYSDHWREIAWNPSARRWQLVRANGEGR